MIPQDYHKKFELFSAQLDNYLLPGVEENLQKHLKECSECRKIFREMENIQLLLTNFKPEEPPEDFETGLLQTAKETMARNPFLRRKLSHIFSVPGIVILILILLIIFYPKPIFRKGSVARTPAISKDRLTQTKKILPDKTKVLFEIKSPQSTPPPHTIIRNEKEWANIWRLQNAGRNVSTLLPEVDFNTKMVLAIISQDDKLEYTIAKTEENKDKIIVVCEETSLTRKNPPRTFLPLYQFQIIPAKPSVTFRMVTKH